MGSPGNKSFSSEHGNGMDLYPGGMGVRGRGGSIRTSDETGTTLDSAGSITIFAGGKVRIEAGEEVHIQTVSSIGGETAGASLCLNGNLDFKGENMVLIGRDYKVPTHYEDAPEEGEFDWVGFFENLCIGIMAAGICAIGVAISVATIGAGSAITGALFATALGCLSEAISGAIGELKSGNLRDSKDVVIDTVREGAQWAFAGAVGIKFPSKSGIAMMVSGVADRTVESLYRNPDMSLVDRMKYALNLLSILEDYLNGKMVDGGLKRLLEKFPWMLGTGKDVRNRLGQPVIPTEKTLDMALDPETYAYAIAEKYGINLKGSGQKIIIKFNPNLRPGTYGKTRAINPNVIEIGPDALVSEKELANTIAHELNHARDFIRGGVAPEKTAYNAGDALADYINGGR